MLRTGLTNYYKKRFGLPVNIESPQVETQTGFLHQLLRKLKMNVQRDHYSMPKKLDIDINREMLELELFKFYEVKGVF